MGNANAAAADADSWRPDSALTAGAEVSGGTPVYVNVYHLWEPTLNAAVATGARPAGGGGGGGFGGAGADPLTSLFASFLGDGAPIGGSSGGGGMGALAAMAPGGIFHSGVEVHGREWAYGGGAAGTGVFWTPPRRIGKPFYRQHHVLTLPPDVSPADVEALVFRPATGLRDTWAANSYDILRRNCNHFVEALLLELAVFVDPDRFAPADDDDAAAPPGDSFGGGPKDDARKSAVPALVPRYINAAARFGRGFVPPQLLAMFQRQTPTAASTAEARGEEAPSAAGTASSPPPGPTPSRPRSHADPTASGGGGAVPASRTPAASGVVVEEVSDDGEDPAASPASAATAEGAKPASPASTVVTEPDDPAPKAPWRPPPPAPTKTTADSPEEAATRAALAVLSVKELRARMATAGISSLGCVEKKDLIDAILVAEAAA